MAKTKRGIMKKQYFPHEKLDVDSKCLVFHIIVTLFFTLIFVPFR